MVPRPCRWGRVVARKVCRLRLFGSVRRVDAYNKDLASGGIGAIDFQVSPSGLSTPGGRMADHTPTQEQIRKRVTVVVCDIGGSTTLAERLDTESLKQVMGDYLDRDTPGAGAPRSHGRAVSRKRDHGRIRAPPQS